MYALHLKRTKKNNIKTKQSCDVHNFVQSSAIESEDNIRYFIFRTVHSRRRINHYSYFHQSQAPCYLHRYRSTLEECICFHVTETRLVFIIQRGIMRPCSGKMRNLCPRNTSTSAAYSLTIFSTFLLPRGQ